MKLIDELNALYNDYVAQINSAVAEDDLDRAAELARSYDRDALVLVATREGRLDDLERLERLERRERRAAKDTPLRRWVRSLHIVPAA